MAGREENTEDPEKRKRISVKAAMEMGTHKEMLPLSVIIQKVVNFGPNKLILKSDCSDLIKFGGTEMVTLKDSNGGPETDETMRRRWKRETIKKSSEDYDIDILPLSTI